MGGVRKTAGASPRPTYANDLERAKGFSARAAGALFLNFPLWEVFAEGEKKGCYPFFDGFRQPTPDCSEPTGDGRIPVSMSLPLFLKSGRGRGAAPRDDAIFGGIGSRRIIMGFLVKIWAKNKTPSEWVSLCGFWAKGRAVICSNLFNV